MGSTERTIVRSREQEGSCDWKDTLGGGWRGRVTFAAKKPYLMISLSDQADIRETTLISKLNPPMLLIKRSKRSLGRRKGE